jgi:hypothetical protein
LLWEPFPDFVGTLLAGTPFLATAFFTDPLVATFFFEMTFFTVTFFGALLTIGFAFDPALVFTLMGFLAFGGVLAALAGFFAILALALVFLLTC